MGNPPKVLKSIFRRRDKKGDSRGKGEEHEDTTNHSPSEAHFPFLRLPPEIRNLVYEYTVIGNAIRPEWGFLQTGSGYVVKACDFRGPRWNHYSKETFTDLVAITRVSRQLQAETRLLVWEFSNYKIRSPRMFLRWVETLKADVRKMVMQSLSEQQRRAVLERWFCDRWYAEKEHFGREIWAQLPKDDEGRSLIEGAEWVQKPWTWWWVAS